MTFSQQPPHTAGLYWYRLVEDSQIYNCRVWYDAHYKTLVAGTGEGYKSVSKFGRWWSTEFLPEPEEMHRHRQKKGQ